MELAKEIEALFNEWREIPFKNESAPVVKEFSEWLAAKLCSRLASRVEELENRVAKHSGSLNSADSASSRTSTHAAKETR